MVMKILLLLIAPFFVEIMQGDTIDLFAAGLKETVQEGEVVIEGIDFLDTNKDNREHYTYTFKSGGPKGVTIHIIIGDVLAQNAHAVVNAANVGLFGGGGMDALIEKKAKEYHGQNVDVVKNYWKSGKPNDWGTGKAFLNTDLRLPGNVRVIQTAGPQCSVKMSDEQKQQLHDSYYNSLAAADQNNLSSIAFPLISAGIYGCDSYEAYLASAAGIFGYFIDHPATQLKDVYIVMYHTKAGSDKNDPETRFRFWTEEVVRNWVKSVGGTLNVYTAKN